MSMRKKREAKEVLRSGFNSLILLFFLCFLSFGVCAIPQTFNIHGKLLNGSSDALSGTHNMTFKIYDSASGGNLLWNSAIQGVTTDSNGVYSLILNALNLSFAEQYYLGVSVGSDLEMSPRINLTSTPYTFRANVSDNLDSSRNYQIGNLTLGQKITFALGEIIDNIQDGFISIIGGLKTSGDLAVNNSAFFVNATSGRAGIGTTAPTHELNVIGSGNFTAEVYVNGSAASPWLYNQTLATYNQYNNAWSSTYNATYDTWAYNQTTATFNLYNSTWDNRGLIT